MKPSELRAVVSYYSLITGRDVPDLALPIWTEKLGQLDERDVRAAIDRLIGSGFPPNVIQIRNEAHRERLDFPTFGEAWAELEAAANSCDYFDERPPGMSHPAVYELACQVGWSNFRVSDPHDTYREHAARVRYEEIIGRAEHRMQDGLPAFERGQLAAMSGEFAELLDSTFKPELTE